ncbi:MAG: PilZ domain-containing protein [Candidatus Omnitrophota bacterium]
MDTEKNVEEKRKFKRVFVPGLKASFKLLDPRTWSTYHDKKITNVANISLGGLALKTNTLLSLQSPIGLDIKVDSADDPIRTFGRVAWIKKEANANAEDDYTLGVSFSWWKKEEDKKIIFDAIQKQIA